MPTITVTIDTGVSYANGLTYIATSEPPVVPTITNGILLEGTSSYCLMLEDTISYLIQE